jgi:NADH:ubiquinone oxidoreductase subunit F (NADH-binding)
MALSPVPLGDVRAWPADPVLLAERTWVREPLDGYLAAGGYAAALPGLDQLAGPRQLSGLGRLLGRGGAAFPTAVKLRAVAESAARSGTCPVVVANGAEGEPLSVKDRYLLRWRPHLVVDGLLLVAGALGATEAVVYTADCGARDSLAAAQAELDEAGLPIRREPGVPLRVAAAQDTYVAGEETAVVRALSSRVARPVDKPPRPFERGVGGQPTLVLNVETLACLAVAAARPAGPDPAGRFLATVSGGGAPPVLYELPAGLPLGELLRQHLGQADSRVHVLMGGFFGGLVPAWPALRLDHAEVARRGSSLGCAALHVLAPDECPVKVAADVAAFFARHNAQQCGTCMSATAAVAATLIALGNPGPSPGAAARLARWAGQLPGRGACAVPDGLAVLLRSLLGNYPEVVSRHLRGGCLRCREAPAADRWAHLAVGLPPGRPRAGLPAALTLAGDR